MKFDYKGMQIFIKDDYEAVSKKAAQLIGAQVTLNPKSILGLATGSSPEGMYKNLVEMYKNDIIDFSDVVTFNLDEYLSLPPNNEQSYAYYMNKHLFNHINISRQNIYIPSGIDKNIEKTCSDYDKSIFEYKKIDLQILGIGTNGHIGFNEPDVHFEAGTHLVNLDQKTIEANSRFFDDINDVPKQAISMGIRNIMQSKKVVLIATGESKIEAINKMLFEEITPNLPASILQVHNDFTLIVDKVIGDSIKGKLFW
ncbi:MAG: glucosamine-6-phosphate deaminase [Lachnospirales bacterium]